MCLRSIIICIHINDIFIPNSRSGRGKRYKSYPGVHSRLTASRYIDTCTNLVQVNCLGTPLTFPLQTGTQQILFVIPEADRRWSLSSQTTQDARGRLSKTPGTFTPYIPESSEREERKTEWETERWNNEEEEHEKDWNNGDEIGDEAENEYYANYREIEEEEVGEDDSIEQEREWIGERELEEEEEEYTGGEDSKGKEEEEEDAEENSAVVVLGDR